MNCMMEGKSTSVKFYHPKISDLRISLTDCSTWKVGKTQLYPINIRLVPEN